MRIYRFITVLLSCVFLTVSLSGCTAMQNAFKRNKVTDTLPVGTITVSKVAVHITNLVASNMLIDDDTISIMLTEIKEAKEQLLAKNVGDNLQKKGYAIEYVLPADKRQKGDISEVSASGKQLFLSLEPLVESSYYKLNVRLAGINFYRMYVLTNNDLVPVSAWTQAGI